MNDLPAVPSLSRGAVDRAAEHRDDADWLAAAWQRGRLLVVDADGRAAIDESATDGTPTLVLVDTADAPADGSRLFLGEDRTGTAYWATPGDLPRRLGARPLNLREVGAALDDLHSGLLVAAVALVNWHRTHPRCPRCGAPTAVEQGGWSRHCEADDSRHFPRTDPAVIVLLHDGDRALLGRQPSWPAGRYSTIAGFVEAGESAEQAVHREVLEETGVTVTDVVYRGSQPWPFPASLMLGYTARVTGGRVEAVDHELEDVRWFSRDELLASASQRPPLLPPPTSIAHWLITTWLAG